MKKKLLILAGDGIGPEVMNEVKKIIVWFNKNKSADFDITEELAGGISFDKHGTPITDEVMKSAMASGTTAKHWKFGTRESPSAMYWT